MPCSELWPCWSEVGILQDHIHVLGGDVRGLILQFGEAQQPTVPVDHPADFDPLSADPIGALQSAELRSVERVGLNGHVAFGSWSSKGWGP